MVWKYITALLSAKHLECEEEKKKTNTEWSARPLKSRKEHLAEIEKEAQYDVVVIGGGCNGAGVLLDAASRGLRCLLIEQADFASGASSKSTKLAHGGIRYLSQAFELSWEGLFARLQKINLVKEAIKQRSLMLMNAPHLTSSLFFVIPSTSILSTAYYYIGSLFYYLFYALNAPSLSYKFHLPYLISTIELRSIFKHISLKYNSGVVYEDGVFNDSRLLLATLFTATNGNNIAMPSSFVPANILNRAQFVRFMKNERGMITGVIFKDTLSGEEHKVNAKYVVNCTGVWADKIRQIDDPNANKRIRIVGGSHLTYSSGLSRTNYGLCLPTSDGRILLMVPWLNRIIAGTTEVDFNQPTENPVTTEEEREFIRNTLSNTFDQLQANRMLEAEVSHWCGLRPLVSQNNTENSKQISRTHVIEKSPSGLLSLMGGKWTIFRKMGEDLVDQICRLQKVQGRNYPFCQTTYLPLWGYAKQDVRANLIQKTNKALGKHLYNHYGAHGQIIAQGNLSVAWGLTTHSQLEWIIRNQMVNSIDDVLLRRTRSAFVDSKIGCWSLVRIVAEIMQKQWNLSQIEKNKLISDAYQKLQKYDFH